MRAAVALLAWPFPCVLLPVQAEMDPMLYGDEALNAARSPMKLHMMPDKGLKGMGAVCLDGSDAGFYFAPAANWAHANSWQIYFQGGGWCYDEIDCWGRSKTPLGSSANWAKFSSSGGIMSDDCEVNPDFCGFNRVHLVYCDGFSFAGDRSEPLIVTGLDGEKRPLYFRGKRILDAVLDTLLGMGLQNAEQVLLTGCSAGGLATFLHTDYVHGALMARGVPMKKFKSAPISGFFLAHATIENRPVYIEEMKLAGSIGNVTGGLNQRCLAAMGAEDKWKCSFAAYAYNFTEAPIFPLNSALDSWQTTCIYSSRLDRGFPEQKDVRNGMCNDVPGWKACMENPENCNATQIDSMNRYIGDFTRDMLFSKTWGKNGNGAFIHSCHTHCEAQASKLWTGFKIQGVSMRQAFSHWWYSEGAPASANSHTDCMYRSHKTPHACNPTCLKPAETESSKPLLI